MLKLDIENVKKTLQKYDFPVDIIIEVTAYCNLKCIMCPQPFLKRERGEMTFETFKKIIDEVAVENPKARIWLAIMGEPLLIGDRLIEMIKYAKSFNLEIHVNSNAEYLTEDIARKLVEANVDEIIVGLDAATKETYDKIRVAGNFEKTVQNIEKIIKIKEEMKATKPTIIMQIIVMEENENELEDFKKYWLSKKTVVKVRPKLGWGTGVKAENLNLEDSERNFPCPWLTRTVSIHWNGRVAQCDADYEGVYSPGNIYINSIKEIWQGELGKRRQKHWDNDFTHELCSKCKDWQAGRSYFYYPEEGEK